jgi:hypothetical protein
MHRETDPDSDRSSVLVIESQDGELRVVRALGMSLQVGMPVNTYRSLDNSEACSHRTRRRERCL